MNITEGFESSKSLLSRQITPAIDLVSTVVQQRIQEVFGEGISPEQAVRQIINDVRNKGDVALRDYTRRIDGIELASIEISKQEIRDAHNSADKHLISALELAAKRIQSYYTLEKANIFSGFTEDEYGMLVRPLERIGIYAPGGTASYPSTVLMTAIPAKVAGVKEIILTTPPHREGRIPAPTLTAASIAGVDRIYSVGGAQAIAAMAFGTESVPKVDKICGPGNIFVVMAKKQVFGIVGIDSLAGPSEVLIIADESANTEWCAADMLAQAEHDPLASVVLITTSKVMAEEVKQQVDQQLKSLQRSDVAEESLKNNGMIVVVDSLDEAIELANLYAPEHLCLAVKDADSCVSKITSAGCIFVGGESSVAFGDYIAGPSHVLPTSGTARFGSPLNVMDFIKFTSLITLNKAELNKIGREAAIIARAEGFEAHARAVEKRLDKNNKV